jgi:hypothetical protein
MKDSKMTLVNSISAVSLILALGVYSFAQPPIAKSHQAREKDEATFKALDDYRDIEKAFNKTLAGRFPFADINDGCVAKIAFQLLYLPHCLSNYIVRSLYDP